MRSVQKNFKRQLDSLDAVFSLIDRFAVEEQVDGEATYALSLALEELFANMVKHQPTRTHDITIELTTEDDAMVVQLTDRDVDSFDPTASADPYLGDSLEARKSGGLGIYLSKKLIDEIQYQYSDRTSVIRLKKNFRRKNV